MTKTMKKEKEQQTKLGDYLVLLTPRKSRKKKMDNEIIISPKGRVSFPAAVLNQIKQGKKKIYCIPLFDPYLEEILFRIGPEDKIPGASKRGLEIKNGTIELYAVMKKIGLLPSKENVVRKIFVNDKKLEPGVFEIFARLQESEQWMIESESYMSIRYDKEKMKRKFLEKLKNS